MKDEFRFGIEQVGEAGWAAYVFEPNTSPIRGEPLMTIQCKSVEEAEVVGSAMARALNQYVWKQKVSKATEEDSGVCAPPSNTTEASKEPNRICLVPNPADKDLLCYLPWGHQGNHDDGVSHLRLVESRQESQWPRSRILGGILKGLHIGGEIVKSHKEGDVTVLDEIKPTHVSLDTEDCPCKGCGSTEADHFGRLLAKCERSQKIEPVTGFNVDVNVKVSVNAKNDIDAIMQAVELVEERLKDIPHHVHSGGTKTGDSSDLEALASLHHSLWMTWAKKIMASEPRLSEKRRERWESYMRPYDKLTEKEKDKDRLYARKVLSLLGLLEGD